MSPRHHVLIVDDDRDLVAGLSLALSAAGFEVSTAGNATDGLAAVESRHPDLILLDVMMPDATEGFHFVWQLRRLPDEYHRSVPVIVLSAIHGRTDLRFYPDSSDGTYRAGEYLPVQDFLDKPVNPDHLVARIRRALSVPAGQ